MYKKSLIYKQYSKISLWRQQWGKSYLSCWEFITFTWIKQCGKINYKGGKDYWFFRFLMSLMHLFWPKHWLFLLFIFPEKNIASVIKSGGTQAIHDGYVLRARAFSTRLSDNSYCHSNINRSSLWGQPSGSKLHALPSHIKIKLDTGMQHPQW